jgi:GNAT superfamily N-acetyltransferase
MTSQTKESSTPNVRPYRKWDTAHVLEMAEHFWDELIYEVPFDSASAYRQLQISAEQGLVYVMEHDGKLVGFVAGIAHPLLGNNSYLTGTEISWWVEPEHRGHGKMLMQAIENAAKDIGCKYWCMIALEHMNPRIMDRIYTRSGYQKTETSYIKEL